jgi:superfamily II DNA or RNA helicase
MDLRPYQLKAVEFLLPRRRAFIVSPAGSGKTVIASYAASQYSHTFDRVLWLANTKEQCAQAFKAIESMKWRDWITWCVKCVAAQPETAGFDLIIIDEAHHLPARTWWTMVAESKSTVWGFSATPWSPDFSRNDTLKAFFGEDNFYTVDRAEVKAGGSITEGVVYVHDLDAEGQFNLKISEKTFEEVGKRMKKFPYIPKEEHEKRARWQFTAEAVRENDRRNRKIVEIANTSTVPTLILVSSIEHGELFKKHIPGSELVFSRMGVKKRKAAIEGFRSGELRVMIATSLADEGLDVPRAEICIMAAGGRSAGKVEQRAGRVMRPHEGKTVGVVHDFSDRGASMAHAQAQARFRTYKKLGYKIIK